MNDIVVFGAGKIGSAVAKLLAHSGDYRVLIADQDERALARLPKLEYLQTRVVDVSKPAQLKAAMRKKKAALSACSFTANPGIARAALEGGLSYFDLTEDVETTRAVKAVSRKARAGQIFMPQCGLAPGFVSICAHALASQFDKLDEVRMRV